MKALKIIGLTIGVLVLLVVIGMYIPGDVNVKRSVTIAAPADVVLNNVSDLNSFQKWNPWYELDTNMVQVVEGEAGQVGHIYTWTSDNVGSGYMKIVDVTDHSVIYELVFGDDPNNASSTSFDVSENEGGTVVEWTMSGEMPFLLSLMMDAGIGADFERGLGYLKSISEEEAMAGSNLVVEEIDLPVQYYIGHQDTLGFAELEAFFGQHFGALYGGLSANAENMATPPTALYWDWDTENQMTIVAAGIGVADPNTVLEGYDMFTVGGGKALQVKYYGPYDGVGAAHEAIDAYLMSHEGMEVAIPVIETYANDPSGLDPSEILTIVTYPLVSMDSAE